MSAVTYDDYYRTGVQDCGNAFEPSDFRDERGTPTQIVDRVWATYEDDGMKEGWLGQNEDDLVADGLDSDRAYAEWARGWKSCAVQAVQAQIDERHEREEQGLDRDFPYYIRAVKGAFNWANPNYPFKVWRETQPFLGRVPQEGDRGFWLGEVLDDILHDAQEMLDRDEMKRLREFVDEQVVRFDQRARKNPADGELTNVYLRREGNGWHVDAQYAHRTVNYGPFRTKERGMRMREAVIESELQRNPKGLTAKGERMYKHVLQTEKLRAATRPRAPEIASRTVLAAAHRGVQSLVRRRNPADEVDAAQDKYAEFHRYDPKRLTELGDLEIPHRVRALGPCAHVLYRSGKVDPATLKKPSRAVDYIHEHDAGVDAYACDGHGDTDVPEEFQHVQAIVKLGKCLGFALRDGTEAHGTTPLPDLACTPDGKCLLVIDVEDEQVLAMIWGGALGVFARGIDG